MGFINWINRFKIFVLLLLCITIRKLTASRFTGLPDSHNLLKLFEFNLHLLIIRALSQDERIIVRTGLQCLLITVRPEILSKIIWSTAWRMLQLDGTVLLVEY